MEELYKLHSKFAIIGITGRFGGGCSEIAKKITDTDFFSNLTPENSDSDVNILKHNICLNYLKYEDNFKEFKIIKYTNVILFHLLYECCFENNKEEAKSTFLSAICTNDGKEVKRFKNTGSNYSAIKEIVDNLIKQMFSVFSGYSCDKLYDCVKDKENFYGDYFENTDHFDEFTKALKDINPAKTNIFFHDKAYNLRKYGCALNNNNDNAESEKENSENVFTVAETINRLIKCYRENNNDEARIVIDSIKNSLELVFFKERYSAFYCIATNKLKEERINYKKNKISNKEDTYSIIEELAKIDDIEYKGSEVLGGKFSSPDIENCIQKSDYHIFYTNDYNRYKKNLKGENEFFLSLEYQLTKFIALLFQPGIITPTPMERNMQIAYNAKLNSGCISRQVGAVITDINHSVKSIGWNDVASGQIPCNLRNINDLKNGKNKSQFSDFEKGEEGKYKDGESFKYKVKTHLKSKNLKNLRGKNCSYCFKTFHNVFEGKSNQVHTRSLHAEENAMLQITKYGGQGIKNGILYTTASPCELCSKKAFQLGIKEIIYIDPYPGIATEHILKSGKKDKNNPNLKMFRGAIGSTFHKLYESTISYKDELNILVDLHPKMTKDRQIKKLTLNEDKQQRIKKILDE